MFGGLRPRNMRIWLDGDKLHALQPRRRSTSCGAMRGEHVEKPAGYLAERPASS